MNIETIWEIWKHTSHGVRALILLGFANLVVGSLCFWDNLKNGRGVDRLTWLLAIAVPIMGPIGYFAIALPEREAARTNEEEPADDWRSSLR